MQVFLQEAMNPMTENPNDSFKKDEQSSSHSAPRSDEQSASDKRAGARGTAAMDQATRTEVARKGGLAVSRNREHMAEIGRKGGQAVSKNREHMARIGRKGGAASRGSIKGSGENEGGADTGGTPPSSTS
jgi:general stress protein YciG